MPNGGSIKQRGVKLRSFPLDQLFEECRAEGHHVYDHGLHCKGDAPGDSDRRFDHMAEAALDQIRRVLREESGTPTFIIDIVIEQIRIVFQAQILYLRREIQSAEAIHLASVDPGKLARNPELLDVYENFLRTGEEDGLGPVGLADQIIRELQRCFPARLQIIRGPR